MSVYFIQRGIDGPIKIGSTRNVDQRLSVLQIASPEILTVRLILDGGLAEERVLQRRFAADRIHGFSREWFQPSEAILDFIHAQPFEARRHFIDKMAKLRPPSKAAIQRRQKEELREMQQRGVRSRRSARP